METEGSLPCSQRPRQQKQQSVIYFGI